MTSVSKRNKPDNDGGALAPDWSRWRGLAAVTVPQAVALACNLDPDSPPVSWRIDAWFARQEEPEEYHYWLVMHRPMSLWVDVPELFDDRLRFAGNHVKHGVLKTAHQSMHDSVSLAAFAQWATGLPEPWILPAQFPRAPTLPAATARATAHEGETRLEKAVRLFKEMVGKQLAKSRPYPLQRDNVDWLMSNGLVKNRTEALAVLKIVKPDDLKPGPRDPIDDTNDE